MKTKNNQANFQAYLISSILQATVAGVYWITTILLIIQSPVIFNHLKKHYIDQLIEKDKHLLTPSLQSLFFNKTNNPFFHIYTLTYNPITVGYMTTPPKESHVSKSNHKSSTSAKPLVKRKFLKKNKNKTKVKLYYNLNLN